MQEGFLQLDRWSGVEHHAAAGGGSQRHGRLYRIEGHLELQQQDAGLAGRGDSPGCILPVHAPVGSWRHRDHVLTTPVDQHERRAGRLARLCEHSSHVHALVPQPLLQAVSPLVVADAPEHHRLHAQPRGRRRLICTLTASERPEWAC